MHDTGLDLELDHLPSARVVAPACQPRANAEGLEQLDEALRPPSLADRAALAASGDSALDGQRPRGLPVPPVRPLAHAASWTASLRQGHELAQLSGVELGDPSLAAADDPLGEVLLLRDQRVDPLLERADARQLAHLDVLALADPERPVGRLVLDRRVPPAVEVDDVVGGGQVQPGAAGLQRQHEQRRTAFGLEPADHLVARGLRRAAVQEQRLASEPLLQVTAQQVPELGELGEAQRLVALGERLGEDLLEPRELAGASGQRRSGP